MAPFQPDFTDTGDRLEAAARALRERIEAAEADSQGGQQPGGMT